MMTAQQTGAIRPRPQPLIRAPRVLLATDDSDTARAAEEWIRRLRWAQPPTIDVLTVAPPPPLASRLWLQTYRTAVREAVLQSREEDLLAAQRVANSVGSRLQKDGTVVRVWARQGSIPDEILATSQLEGPDLVVMGRQSKSPHILARGSNIAEQVAKHADAAVLIANRPPDGPGPLPRSTLLVIPAGPAGEEALRWLQWAGWLQQTDLTVAWRGRPEGSGSDAPRRLALAAGVAHLSEREVPTEAGEWAGELMDPEAFDLVVLPLSGSRSGDELRAATESRTTVLILPRGSTRSANHAGT